MVVCCSVLQCVVVCCSVLQCVDVAIHNAICCNVLQCVVVCRSVSQCVAVCRSVMPRIAVCGIVYGVATTSRLFKIICLFCKQPYKRDGILQKRPIILRSLLIVATPYEYMHSQHHFRSKTAQRPNSLAGSKLDL